MSTAPTLHLSTWDEHSASQLRWSRRMPYVVCVLVLYSILVLGFTMGAGGEPDGGTGSDIGVKYNVVSENLKILSFTTHYPDVYPSNVSDAQTSYLISWYFTSGCARPANNSANSLPCIDHPPWTTITFDGILSMVDQYNRALAGQPITTTSAQMKTTTTQAVASALGHISTTGPFAVFVAGMAMSALGLVLYLRPRRRRLEPPVVCFCAAMPLEIVAAAWMTLLAYDVKRRVGLVDQRFAREVKIGDTYMALVWTAVVATAIGTFCCIIHWAFWRRVGENRRNAEMEERRREQEERLMNQAYY